MGSWPLRSLRRRTREIVAYAKPGDTWSRVFDVFIVGLILLNVVAMVLESERSVRAAAHFWFALLEYFSVLVFSTEYILRIWSCVEEPEYRRPVLGRIRFAVTPLALVDLLAVLPFYLPFVTVDLRVLRMFRIMRIMRIAKLGRYSESLQILRRVLAAKREQLVSTFLILLILLIVSAAVMYYAENEAQPEAFGSIPAAMWWAVTTLTTVGYGDVYPVTVFGKLMGAVIAILGIGMFALPTGILGAGFVEATQNRKRTRRCPHCGLDITGSD